MKYPAIPDNCRVYSVNLPPAIRGCTRVSEDGFYSVYISDALSPAAKRRTLAHELRHILRDDLFTDLPIEEIEKP